ncbi:MAG: TRAFs-binding domain-containing protein [Bacteroidota bacterium]|nr:TRAFs-binding domain-containing protein [Bacteroidota bacterium]
MTDLCFVIMPFGEKINAANKKIDFDIVYDTLIKPAIIKSGLKSLREDESTLGGIVIKNMFQRILFCDIAITDITFDNPNVYYELGIRHAVRTSSTIIICEKTHKTHPFNITGLRIIEYEYDFERKEIKDGEKKVAQLQNLLTGIKAKADVDPDSPLKLLLEEFEFPKVDYLKTTADEFEDWVKGSQLKIENIQKIVAEWKKLDAGFRRTKEEAGRLAQQKKIEELKGIEDTLKPHPLKEYPLLIAILKAYKDTNSNDEIIKLLESPFLPDAVRMKYIELEERRANAYKMSGKYDEAEVILCELVDKSNTEKAPWLRALLASVYKHKAGQALKDGKPEIAKNRIKKAIELYTQSFEDNPNDYYPGIRLLSLLYTSNLEDAKTKFEKYLPLVEFSISRRLNKNKKEYWALASRVELEVMKGNVQAASDSACDAVDSQHAYWKRESTVKQLNKIAAYKESILKEDVTLIRDIIKVFEE